MNSHNPLQDAQPFFLTQQDGTLHFGLQRSWEWEQPKIIVKPKEPEPPKQNYFVRRGRQLFVLKKNITQ